MPKWDWLQEPQDQPDPSFLISGNAAIHVEVH